MMHLIENFVVFFSLSILKTVLFFEKKYYCVSIIESGGLFIQMVQKVARRHSNHPLN